jgi:protein-tyrosine phosphatase
MTAPTRVDLHCHWVANIDDGARAPEQGLAMLRGLRALGYREVVATPHMRPGMFDNDRARIEEGYAAMAPHLAGAGELPAISLASEHWFDDVVYARIVEGRGVPYRGGGSLLVEVNPRAFPVHFVNRLFDLRRAGFLVVLAHPERYEPVWKDDRCLDPLLDAGAALLMDVASLAGKYGRAPQKAAEKLLDEDAYEAVCTDTHKPEDLDAMAKALDLLERRVGREEAHRLTSAAPAAILERPRGGKQAVPDWVKSAQHGTVR